MNSSILAVLSLVLAEMLVYLLEETQEIRKVENLVFGRDGRGVYLGKNYLKMI